MPWNPDQYHKFTAERSAPFDDLLELVEIRPNLQVADLGCGTGGLTSRLADALPGSQVVGLDNSPPMLAKAAPKARPGLRFELGDQAALRGKWDLIFSNASLHWSQDHPRLIASLFDLLLPQGQLAVQIPSNQEHISQRLIIEPAREAPFVNLLDGYVRMSPVLSIVDYAQILKDASAANIVVFEKVYPHLLESADAVVEWLSGTALIPYLERLGPNSDSFLRVIREKMRAALPGHPVFYPFRRILFSARRRA